MKITVLQGLNLKNSCTTVIAEMQAVKADLPEFFKTLHSVFMQGYLINGTSLEVQTHLPHLWRNERFLDAIEKHSVGAMEFQQAKLQMLEVVKLLVNSMSTIPILQAAHEMGLETIPFYLNGSINEASTLINRYYSIGIGHQSAITVSASSTGDSHLAQKTQKDKWLTNTFIEAMNIPMAPWALIESKEKLSEAAKEVGYPLVIKPVGLTAGHGVMVGIKDETELTAAYGSILTYFDEMDSPKAEWQKKIIIQKMVKGDDYRILVVNGIMEIATHRIPARVIGDGTNTIRKLIETENTNPARDITLPTHTLKPITIDETLEKIVAEQGLKLDDVPQKDQPIQVRKVASMSQGGITKDVTDSVHPQIRLICESIARSIHANVLGIDVLCLDISKPLTIDNGSIIEMNTMPEAYLNAFPVIGKPYPEIGKKILGGIIDPSKHTNTVVVVGDMPEETVQSQIKSQFPTSAHIGTLKQNTIYLDGNPINTIASQELALCSLKKNRLLDTIVVHHANTDEVGAVGFGFDKIDLLLMSESLYPQIAEAIERHSNAGLIKIVSKI